MEMFLVLICVRGWVDWRKGKEECGDKEIEKGKQKLKVIGEDIKEKRGKEDKLIEENEKERNRK